MGYERLHDICTESLEDQWLEHTNHGRLYRSLEDYDSDLCLERYAKVRSRLEGRRADYVEEHWDEEWDGLIDSEDEKSDKHRYHGVSRSDF